MRYRRSAIEIESPEQLGYENIAFNLAESSIRDVKFKDLELNLDNLVLEYGNHFGKPDLRDLIVADADRVDRDDVLLSVGAAGALFIIATALLNSGDHIIVAFPNYVTNLETPRAIGCQVDYLPLEFERGFEIDIERLASLITPRTRLVSLTTPHNPTGSVMREADLQQIVTLVESNNCYLLLDETYREMSFSKPLPLAASLSSKAISVSSLSKTYGLPGIRLGWIICQDEQMMETFLAAKEQIHISNSVVDEEIAFRFLQRKEDHLRRIRLDIETNLAVMKQWINQQNLVEWIEPAGGVVCFPRIKPEVPVDVDRFYEILNNRYKTYVGPGHWFEVDRRYMRVGYGWPTSDELKQGLNNVSQAVQEACP